MENKSDVIDIYIVERRLFRSSRETVIVGAFLDYHDAQITLDALPEPCGRITTVRMNEMKKHQARDKGKRSSSP